MNIELIICMVIICSYGAGCYYLGLIIGDYNE